MVSAAVPRQFYFKADDGREFIIADDPLREGFSLAVLARVHGASNTASNCSIMLPYRVAQELVNWLEEKLPW